MALANPAAACMLFHVQPVMATLPQDTAERVAADIRDFGEGYVRFDREGRAHHVPPPWAATAPSVSERRSRMHE